MPSAPFLTPAETKISVLLSASVERFGVSHMRDFWNLNQSIEQKIKNLLLEKFRNIKDIQITFWDTAECFHSKQLR